jgi:hypothetical protein
MAYPKWIFVFPIDQGSTGRLQDSQRNCGCESDLHRLAWSVICELAQSSKLGVLFLSTMPYAAVTPLSFRRARRGHGLLPRNGAISQAMALGALKRPDLTDYL